MLLGLPPAWQRQVAKRGRNGNAAGVWERLGPAKAQRRQQELQPAEAGAEPEGWAGSAGGAGTELQLVVSLQEVLQEAALKGQDLRLKTNPIK